MFARRAIVTSSTTYWTDRRRLRRGGLRLERRRRGAAGRAARLRPVGPARRPGGDGGCGARIFPALAAAAVGLAAGGSLLWGPTSPARRPRQPADGIDRHLALSGASRSPVGPGDRARGPLGGVAGRSACAAGARRDRGGHWPPLFGVRRIGAARGGGRALVLRSAGRDVDRRPACAIRWRNSSCTWRRPG